MEKLATYLVREGALPRADAVGWVVRLTISLEVLHRIGAAHGRISAKAIDVLGPHCRTGGFFLDAPDLLDEPRYQSPERLAGGTPSAADDVWAAGVLLYQLLTGALPFAGTTASQVAQRIARGPPAPLSDHGVTDAALGQLVAELFSSLPSTRMSSVAELRHRLLACEPGARGLAPLKLGKPSLRMFDTEDSEDDAGEKLTAVMPRDRLDAALQDFLAGRRSGAAEQATAEQDVAPAPTPDAWRIASRAGQQATPSAPVPPTAAASALPRPKRGRRVSRMQVLGGALAMLIGAATAVQVYRPGAWRRLFARPAARVGPAAPSSSRGAISASAGTVPNGGPDAATLPSAPATADPTSVGSAAAPPNLRACVLQLVGPYAVRGGVASFRRVCSLRHARRGGTALRSEIIRAGGGVPNTTRAMREWAKLGWYEMAAFAVVRRRCCAHPDPLHTPLGFRACSLDAALDQLGRSAAGGGQERLAQAQADFEKAVRCLIRHGAARYFGQSGPPDDDAREAFDQLLTRLHVARD